MIYINNFIYRIFKEHRVLSTTPFMRTSSPMGRDKSPFNIPHLAKSCGAQYVARWTPLHPRRLMHSIIDALQRQVFSMIEVISPCLMYYASDGKIGEKVDRMKLYHTRSVIKNGEPTENLDIRSQDKIIVGKFVDKKCIEVDRVH